MDKMKNQQEKYPQVTSTYPNAITEYLKKLQKMALNDDPSLTKEEIEAIKWLMYDNS